MSSKTDLKIALVTGAAMGIGTAIVEGNDGEVAFEQFDEICRPRNGVQPIAHDED